MKYFSTLLNCWHSELYHQWILVSSLLSGFSYVTFLGIVSLLRLLPFHGIYQRPTPRILILYLCFGLITGLSQWWVIRSRFEHAYWWIIASVAGSLLVALFLITGDLVLYNLSYVGFVQSAIKTIFPALAISIPQALFFASRTKAAWKWVAFALLAHAIALPLDGLLNLINAQVGWPNVAYLTVTSLLSAVSGAVLGAIAGIPLVKFAQNQAKAKRSP